MKAQYKILIAIIVLLVAFYLLNNFRVLGYLNQPLNKMINGEPDKSCQIDSDCKLQYFDCDACCKEAVNKDWKPDGWEAFCPFRYNFVCDICVDSKAVCKEGKCEAVETFLVD